MISDFEAFRDRILDIHNAAYVRVGHEEGRIIQSLCEVIRDLSRHIEDASQQANAAGAKGCPPGRVCVNVFEVPKF